MKLLFCIPLLLSILPTTQSTILQHRLSSPPSSPESPRIALSRYPCTDAALHDFFACNCHFLRLHGYSALLPRHKISDRLLSGALQSCLRTFGGPKGLREACTRMVGTRWFEERKTVEAMKRLVDQCGTRGEVEGRGKVREGNVWLNGMKEDSRQGRWLVKE